MSRICPDGKAHLFTESFYQVKTYARGVRLPVGAAVGAHKALVKNALQIRGRNTAAVIFDLELNVFLCAPLLEVGRKKFNLSRSVTILILDGILYDLSQDKDHPLGVDKGHKIHVFMQLNGHVMVDDRALVRTDGRRDHISYARLPDEVVIGQRS